MQQFFKNILQKRKKPSKSLNFRLFKCCRLTSFCRRSCTANRPKSNGRCFASLWKKCCTFRLCRRISRGSLMRLFLSIGKRRKQIQQNGRDLLTHSSELFGRVRNFNAVSVKLHFVHRFFVDFYWNSYSNYTILLSKMQYHFAKFSQILFFRVWLTKCTFYDIIILVYFYLRQRREICLESLRSAQELA